MKVEDSQLKAFILDAGLTTKDKLDKAEKKAKKIKEKLTDVLVKEKLLLKNKLLN